MNEDSGNGEKTWKRGRPNQASVKQTVDIARNVSRLDPESVLCKQVNVRNTHIPLWLILRELLEKTLMRGPAISKDRSIAQQKVAPPFLNSLPYSWSRVIAIRWQCYRPLGS
ncbi:hypothetical protein PUN28_001935 [Cardiocondyla obscurior]|uniref:Uncharacterized protein n=1 Tax=Cardiocondyla obscurior TaxID=286306 RepID=A0AAW2GRW0_9HYME